MKRSNVLRAKASILRQLDSLLAQRQLESGEARALRLG